ncbi:MAG TPA: carboxylating nicotinate-nucleotide diphosphorylase [Candidatus Sumerlaeota bacterium]|nr:MAG: putative nicotinate-nucleotide pyrophosphorylase (carboxylating) [candidate division BRC1 bacterium ADurb.BinA292]HPK00876.1 carboxylating nicotinate-nucleotide diphosphorylase [Candidatus Sumerlaeota bacterium]
MAPNHETVNRAQPQLQLTPELTRLLRAALKEDLGPGDVTTERTVAPRVRGRGELIAKQAGVLCGAPVAAAVWRLADRGVKIQWHCRDGERVRAGDRVATLEGRMRGLLVGERLALNFLQRLSGIATLTCRFHDAAGGANGPLICDTRKTTPLWRALERYAVRVGGGMNHRFGLFDMVLIKENHARAAGGLREAIRAVKAPGAQDGRKRLKVMAEARDAEEVAICCAEGVDLILLDNFTPARARAVIARFRSCGIPFEISGGVTLKNVAAYARAGADRISIGALTHSAPALDLSLQLYPVE